MNISNVLQYTSKRHYYHGPRNLIKEAFESIFTMANVEQPLRFIKFAMKLPNKKRTQIMIVTTYMDMQLKTLFKIIRARWDIENSIFNNLKSECGLEHCFVHEGKAVEAVLHLIFIKVSCFLIVNEGKTI
jgi:hypothetical protein